MVKMFSVAEKLMNCPFSLLDEKCSVPAYDSGFFLSLTGSRPSLFSLPTEKARKRQLVPVIKSGSFVSACLTQSSFQLFRRVLYSTSLFTIFVCHSYIPAVF